MCDDEVAEDSSKKLLECVQLVKREAQKPVLDQEQAEAKVQAVLSSMTPLLSDMNSVSADIKIRKSAVASTTLNMSLKPDKGATSAESAESFKSAEMLPRVRGLTNLGNTCFFNAMMQNLSQTPFLLEVLKETSESGEHFELPGGAMKGNDNEELEVPKIKGQLKEWGQFTQVLAETLEELQTKSGGVFTPRVLLKQFTSKWPQFAGGDQHDSHEALRHLLESVRSEDLRRFQLVILQELGYSSKIDPNAVESEEKAKIKFYGSQAQDRILRPEPVFRGFLVSTLTCQDCNNISPRQETFLDISLPVTTDKPHPPSARRKNSPEPSEKQPAGPTKSQAKKEKRAERKAKRTAKNQMRKQQQSSATSIDDENKETENVSSPMSESDADVEDSITDDPQSRSKLACDANGNNTELKSPQSPEKKDDMPENPHKGDEAGAGNFVCDATISSSGLASLIGKVKIVEDEAIGEDEKQKAIKSQQLLRQQQHRTRQISHADWSNTLGPRYQCPEGELSVQSCLNHFMSVEYMMGNNKVGCEACTERINGRGGKTVYANATKQFLISSPPAVLILHLKRFQVGMRGMFRKITKHVEFQTTLDLAPFCASKVKLLSHIRRHQKELLYSLYGIVEHSGGMHGKLQ